MARDTPHTPATDVGATIVIDVGTVKKKLKADHVHITLTCPLLHQYDGYMEPENCTCESSSAYNPYRDYPRNYFVKQISSIDCEKCLDEAKKKRLLEKY
jgi:hypothetical protein